MNSKPELLTLKKILPAIFILLFTCLSSLSLFSQEIICSSGNQEIYADGSLSWTLGENVIETFQNSTTILTQGFQQSKLYITAVAKIPDLDLIITIFPNPASDVITVQVTKPENKMLRIVVFDLQGKPLLENKLDNNLTQISLKQLAPSSYIVKVYDNSQEIRVFKIIKIN